MSDKSHERYRFEECGFGIRTAGVLVKAGIDAPERLLSMTSEQIRLIQGIGPILMKEVERYRAQATGARCHEGTPPNKANVKKLSAVSTT